MITKDGFAERREEVQAVECSPLNESMCNYVRQLEHEVRRLEGLAREAVAAGVLQNNTIDSLREQLRQRTAERDEANARAVDESTKSRAAGWDHVVKVLDEVKPGWLHGCSYGMVAAQRAIRELAARKPMTVDRAGALVKEGANARDDGSTNPYACNSIDGYLHATGWVQRDLRVALDAANATIAMVKREAEALHTRNNHLTDLGRKLASERLRMSYNSSYFGEPAGWLKWIAGEFDTLCPGAPLRAATKEQHDAVDEMAGLPTAEAEQPQSVILKGPVSRQFNALAAGIRQILAAGGSVQMVDSDGKPIGMMLTPKFLEDAQPLV